MVFFFSNNLNNSSTYSIIDVICHADMLLMESMIATKSPPSLLLVMARVNGSDKLGNSNLSYRQN